MIIQLMASMFLAMASILCWITGVARIYRASKRIHPCKVKIVLDIILISSLFGASVIWALETFQLLPSDPRTIVLIIPPLIIIILAVFEDTVELLP